MAEPAIAVNGLSKRFGDLLALDRVSFEVAPGTVFGVLGPNGAGKTTCIRILTTILRPDAGSARILGLDVVRDAAAVRHQIGLAGQYAAVDPNLTGRENLQLMGRLAQLLPAEYKPRAEELLGRFELADAAGRPVRQYSGGMRRRLDVAAALVARPPVLFLDEPTTGLDPRSRNELWGLIRQLVAEGTTVLLTTQYLEEADRLTDRIAVIDRGRVLVNDTAAALKAQLGTTVIELTVDETLAGRGRVALADTVGARVERDGAILRVMCGDGTNVLLAALHALDREGIAPSALAVREPSLDEVFLRLTDRAASGAGRASPALSAGGRP